MLQVTFIPSQNKQIADLLINNDAETSIMYKMKSTRPGLYKMRPVFGVVDAKDKAYFLFCF
uniref:MSP domain-containing protein n=1 Tax=Heterorhabditis bacteriophora TaxID=37862 RepID=A0A1I7W8Y8_HETBA